MIQPLRTVHRRSFIALVLVLPAILIIGLGARRARSRPIARVTGVPATASLVRDSSELWRKHEIQSRFYRQSDNPQDTYVVLQPAQELNEPDLLLYWSSDVLEGNALPDEARLLGAFVPGRAFIVPFDERGSHLILFSLAHQSIVDTAALERLP